MILLFKPAEAVDFSNTFSSQQLFFNDPVLNRPEFHIIISGIIAVLRSHNVLINFTKSGTDRSHFRFTQTFRHILFGFFQLLKNKVSCKVCFNIVFKNHSYYRYSEFRDRAHLNYIRQTLHCYFYGIRYEPFNFSCR